MSVQPSLRSLFETALNEFESRTGINLVQQQVFNSLMACESIDSVLDILQEQSKPLRSSLENDNTLMMWIKRTVHVLHFLSTNHIVVSGVSLAFPPAKAVFAGIAILLSVIKVSDKSYDTLVDLFESFQSFLRRLDIYTRIPSTIAITEVIVKILAELLSTISLAIQQAKQGRLKKLGKMLLGENDREVESILRRLDRLTMEEAQMTGTTTLEVVYDLLRNMKMVMDDKSVLMDDIRRTLVDMQQVANNMNKLRRNELQEKVRRWLSPPDPSINHNTARNTHHEGSARWFIDGNTYQGWKMGTGSLIWVNGKPGSGKSILSSSVIEDLKFSGKAGLASIVFFYFDFKDESKKNARGALTSLLVQLAAQSDPYSEILSALYSEHNAGSMQPSDDALKMSLKSMLAVPDQAPIYIVIDALDECPNTVGTPTPREKMLSLVEWLSESCHSNLWICLTSRPEADIEVILQPLSSHIVSLHGETGQQKDITNYIKWFVSSDPKARKWRKQDKELVIEKLSERAEGMFRWVFCQLDRLRRCIISRIRHALDELPETLDETYERTLLDIDKENWAYAHRLFQCLLVAFRPLSVKELADFLAFEFEDGTDPIFREDCRPEDPRDAVLSTCSSLIAIVDDYPSPIVQFSHFSVKEYLTSTRITEGRVPRYYIPLEPAHILVTLACLSILLQLDSETTTERIKGFPLVKYAAQYWVGHEYFGNALLRIEDMMKRLFDPRNPHFSRWIAICDFDPLGYLRINSSRATPLYYAALLNLYGVAEWLVNTRSQDINALGGGYGTPLHAACGNGSLEVAEFLLVCRVDDNRVTVPGALLNQGANVNAINDRGQTPLSVALAHGPTETLIMEAANLLLCHGANPFDLAGRSLIYSALLRGYRDLVHLLQRHGADPTTRDNRGGTLLHVASERGALKVAQGLLELGVDINSRDNQGRTPIHVIGRQSEDVALLLLEHGTDPSVQDNDGQTPLHAASRSGHLEFAQRLLELGVSVNVRDNRGRIPLHVIAEGSDDLAILLLEHGTVPGVRDDDGQTLLHAASRSGNLKFARRLLELGVAVNSRDNQGRTPFHVIQEGSDDVALLLLEHGADPGVRDDYGQTTLHAASRSGGTELALRLLELGVSVNSRDNQGRTPLHILPSGVEYVAIELLKRGADPGIRDNAGQTPLHAASRVGSRWFAEQLLEFGADINSRDNQGRTPLHLAEWMRDDVASLLLERGANPGVRDDNGQTPLHTASQGGSLRITMQLLGLGADINSRDNRGRTPLHLISIFSEDAALLLLNYGATPGIQEDNGQTPLHVASKWGMLETTLRLLELGADINSRDNQGRTPLHEIQRGSGDVALILLEHGADPGVQDDNCETPLHVASRLGWLKIARRLLELGAVVNSHDNQGRTPFQIAVERGHYEVEELLLEYGAERP